MENGQLCPLAKAAEILAERWTFLLIRELLPGALRFNQIRRGVPLMSPSLLSQRLQRLEHEGLITRVPLGSTHLYSLTDAGQELAPVVQQLSQWGERWVLGHIDESKLDVTAMMWAIRRRVDPLAFDHNRVVVEFQFTDQPQAKSHWWLINERASVDLCPKDPGFEIDLYVITDLRSMADIWVGKLPLSAAIDAGRLELIGRQDLTDTFKSWILLSPLARKSDLRRESTLFYAEPRPSANQA